jgi:peroxiredoxin Q/BCP
LPFPVLSDTKGDVLRAYGVRGFLGFARRVSFLIDPAGVVRRVWRSVAPRGHAEDVLAELKRLRAAS